MIIEIDRHRKEMKKKLFLYFLCIVIIVLVIKNIIILLNDNFIEEDELEPIRKNIDSMNILCYNQTSTSDSLPSIDGKLGMFIKFD